MIELGDWVSMTDRKKLEGSGPLLLRIANLLTSFDSTIYIYGLLSLDPLVTSSLLGRSPSALPLPSSRRSLLTPLWPATG